MHYLFAALPIDLFLVEGSLLVGEIGEIAALRVEPGVSRPCDGSDEKTFSNEPVESF